MENFNDEFHLSPLNPQTVVLPYNPLGDPLPIHPDGTFTSSEDQGTGELNGVMRSESMEEGFDGKGKLKEEYSLLGSDDSVKKMIIQDGPVDRKKKGKEFNNDSDKMPDPSVFKKRREEKERKAYLQQLHADSQRLLRETRDTSFKSIPVMQKPISSVLEKIRKRKMELSMKSSFLDAEVSNMEFTKYPTSFPCQENISTMTYMDVKLGNAIQDSLHENREEMDGKPNDAVQHTPDDDTEDVHVDSQGSDKDDVELSNDEDDELSNDEDVELSNDEDDELSDDEDDELPNDDHNNPLEEVKAPSLLTMNLKLDFSSVIDVAATDDGGRKTCKEISNSAKLLDCSSSPRSAPVKAFLDDEAEEEDDSDNDQRFEDSEDEEKVDEFVDLIATGNEEKVMDSKKRNQLHQKWLEQQDDAGTENLLRRLKGGSSKHHEPAFLIDGDDERDDDKKFSDGDKEDDAPSRHARVNIKKIKQMIPEMYNVKEAPYESSDDEEIEIKANKRRVIEKSESKLSSLPPSEDSHKKEGFGLIKKLNTPIATTKKPNPSSCFDLMLMGENTVSSTPSFIGRGPSVRKIPKVGGLTRAYIFGRDNSNSRNSTLVSDDSSDKVYVESKQSESASQSKTINNLPTKDDQNSDTPLLDILNRSCSSRSEDFSADKTPGFSEFFSVLKSSNKQARRTS